MDYEEYIHKPVKVKAIQYYNIQEQFNLFISEFNVVSFDCNDFYYEDSVWFEDVTESQPISIGDYIVKDEYGHVKVVKQEDFDKYYSKVDKNTYSEATIAEVEQSIYNKELLKKLGGK